MTKELTALFELVAEVWLRLQNEVTLQGLTMVGSFASILAFLALLTPKAVRLVRSENDLLRDLAQAYLLLRPPAGRRAVRTGSKALASPAEAVSKAREDASAEARLRIGNAIFLVSGIYLTAPMLPHLEIARSLQRRGEAGSAAWFYEQACSHQADCRVTGQELRQCLVGLEDCQLGLWRLAEALETHHRRLSLSRSKKSLCIPGRPRIERDPWVTFSLSLSIPLVSAKYFLRAVTSLLFRRRTNVLLVLRS